ncbi:MAG: 4-(cytidine 5'-diphospho)-2-C-methyl-D-erythritol kinase [Deltaproteobacteria bacterium]|nr:4-(cytidine 5'-diphospho)-2-C-methyl-D-erythritol kinase [Deltaproteobacteria bacterium]MCL5276977.1 4-(cytidine 5'-diphospho)-2-C-methyl-D-erythritol kinase [Deltaproteobacteria bacterium]
MIPSSASLAPAKLNLFLYVMGKRDDGYHDIVTLMQKVSLYDRISVSLEEAGAGLNPAPAIDIHITDLTGRRGRGHAQKSGGRGGDGKIDASEGIPTDERNTAYTAAKLFFGHGGVKIRKVTIEIEKHIPVESGMGGASSDAACVLRMLNGLVPTYTDEQLFGLSKSVGSDVPFFMTEGAGLASGRGDAVKPVMIGCPLHYVVIKPDFGISTAWAYSHLNILTENKLPSMCDLAIYTEDDIMRCLRNDLEMVTGRYTPAIKAIKERLLSFGAKAAMMTGSGSCIFGIFHKEQEAETVFKRMSTEYTSVYKLRGI